VGTLDSVRRRYGTCCCLYAVDVIGQPNNSRPGEPICNAADFVAWVTGTGSQL
jgi:hypothetical protein